MRARGEGDGTKEEEERVKESVKETRRERGEENVNLKKQIGDWGSVRCMQRCIPTRQHHIRSTWSR